MEYYAIINKISNTIISYYNSDSGIDITKPGTDHLQDNLVHMIVPDEFKNQNNIKVSLNNSSNYVFQIDQNNIDQPIKNQWDWLREQRNKKLAESDWACSIIDPPENILAQRNNWIAYRQALRDITKQSDPFNIVWPTPPS